MTQRALVLGAGGSAAMAWQTGMIAGLAEAGVELRNADLFVGTSAGSRVAAQMTSGVASAELFRQQVDPNLHTDEQAPAVDWRQWRNAIARAKEGATDESEFMRRVGSLIGAASTAAERRKVIASWLPERDWPERRMQLVAIDADCGERHVFERTAGVALPDAVAASGALAGVYPAVTIDGRRYVDGGFYSTDNADLAVGFDQVVIPALKSADPPLCVMSLDAAVRTVRNNGAPVEVVHPEQATEAAFAAVGGDILDAAIQNKAAQAGRAQGRAGAVDFAPLWQ